MGCRRSNFDFTMGGKTLALFAIILSLSVYYSQAQTVPFIDCGSSFYMNDLLVEGCTSHTCSFYINTDIQISFLFKSGKMRTNRSLRNRVYIVTGGAKFEIGVTPQDACKVLKCPIQQNYNTTYKAVIHVPDFPPLVAMLRWVIEDFYSEQLLCFDFPIYVLEP